MVRKVVRQPQYIDLRLGENGVGRSGIAFVRIRWRGAMWDEWDEVGGIGATAAATLRAALPVVRRRIARDGAGNRF